MATKLVASFTYTDEELLALYREAAAQIPVTGQSYQIAGRTYTAVNIDALWRQIEQIEQRIASASNGLVTNYTRLVRR